MKKTALVLFFLPVFCFTQKTAVKLNLTSLPLGNYQIQAERLIIPHVAFNLSAGIMPKQGIPFAIEIQNRIEEEIDDPDIDIEDVENFIDQTRFDNKQITPELRFYVRKELKGFYLSVYARKGTANVSGPSFLKNSQDVSVGTAIGENKYQGIGLMLGNQFNIGRKIVLDWWIIGAHINKVNSTFTLNANEPLTAQQQTDLVNRLEDIKVELLEYAEDAGREATMTYTVNSTGYVVKTKAPAPGLRAGLSLGIKF